MKSPVLSLAVCFIAVAATAALNDPIVFVSRQIPNNGTIYWSEPKDMPGVGAHSRFINASPGKLQIRETNGTIRTLIDGANPTAGSLNLVDVNAPNVYYDGQTIVFAGLNNANASRSPVSNPGAWRIYTIRVDGTSLRQVTTAMTVGQVPVGFAFSSNFAYDDTDPVWLPDGRLCFTSTRWPSYGHYSGVRATNLYVINADGTNIHRITSERNGADRPLVDPVTGKIVYSRWWRNHRFPTNDMGTVPDPGGTGYLIKDGLTSDRNNHIPFADNMFRNAWQIATINPDGTGLAMWGGAFRREGDNHFYGGSFTPQGDLFANYFPMPNMTEAAGFGGIRRYRRGPGTYTSVIGVTITNTDYVKKTPPESFGVQVGNYAGEPDVLPDGSLLISWTPDHLQDYGLYVINPDGSGRTLIYDNPGTTELRARVVRARPLPPILMDTVNQTASLLPPSAAGPYDIDGTFVFDALNVFANGPVDADINSAPAIGSAAKIRFFIDHQWSSPGSFPNLDWPITLGERAVDADGAVRENAAPANVPLFEQLRGADGSMPATRNATGVDGAAHVAGMNFGRPGTVARCVGCHAGHTMIAVPSSDEEAKWSNLAPGAQVTVSSTRDANQNRGVIDRRVMKGEIWRTWMSASGQTTNQWAQLTFPVPVTVRTVRLYNTRQGDEANSSIQVQGATVRLYSDAAATQQIAQQTIGAVAISGTDVPFANARAQAVRVTIDNVTGTFYGARMAGLAEIEVIARGGLAPSDPTGPAAPRGLRRR